MKKLALLSVAVACAAAQMAHAEVALDPQAYNFEPAVLTPTLEVEARQDSNIYKFNADEVSSFGLLVKPAFDLVTQDRENTYSARYAPSAGFFSEDINNFIDHVFSLNAHVEPTGRFRFDVGAAYSLLHDDLGTAFTEGFSLSQINGRGSPDEYTQATLNGGVEYGAQDAAGQIAFNMDYGQKRYDPADAAAARDIDTLNAMLEFRLRVMPKTKALLDIEYGKGDYDNATTAATSDYTNKSYLLGLTWEESANTTGKVRVGTNMRDSASTAQKSSFTWDLGVVWTPLERSKFTLDGSRKVADGTLPTISIDTRIITAGWGHDWSERLESKVTLGQTTDDHTRQAGSSPRDDKSNTLGAVLNYQMRRWLVLGVGASMTSRDSSLNDFDYDRKIFSLNAQLSL